MHAKTPSIQDAFALHRQGRLDEAARIYEAIAAREPKNAEARHYLGALLASAGRIPEARALMKRALDLKPGEFAFLENYVGVLVLAEAFEEALERSRLALERQPRNINLLYLNAASLQKLDRLEEARTAFVELLRLAPNHPAGRKEYAVTLSRLGEQDEALRIVEALVAEQPRFADAYLVRANVRAIRGEYRLAVADYERALTLQPNAHETWFSYGRALERLSLYDKALAAFDRALALRPTYVDALVGRGDALKLLDRASEAFACYDQAIARGGEAQRKGLVARASALAQAGRSEEARAELRRVTELYENSGAAWRELADLVKFEPGDPAFATMEARLASGATRTGPETLALHFALGKAYLDIGDSQRAFGHLNAANRLKRAQLPYDADANSARMAAIAKAFPAELFARFAGAGSRTAAPIFVVGMPRSGTTLIEQILASHPTIHGAGELPFLPQIAAEMGGVPEGVAALAATRLASLGEAYVARIGALAPGKSRWVDKLPGNFVNAGLIRLILPEARIIHSRRDPVDACLSCYTKDFESPALAFAYDMTELGRYSRDYLALMAHWRSVLPESHFLEVDYEAVVDDLEREARRMIAFLDLPWDAACLDFHQTNRPVRTSSVNQVRRPIYRTSAGRWRAHADCIGPLLQALGVSRML
jgi:tetratricopeptide (TPR) repeat protein